MRSAAVKTLSAPVKPAFAALVFIVAASAFAPQASALPGVDRQPAAQAEQGLQKARWVCGPYRCWWRPDYGWGQGYGWGHGYGWGGGDGWGRGYGWGGGPGWRRPGWGPGYGWGGGWRGRDW